MQQMNVVRKVHMSKEKMFHFHMLKEERCIFQPGFTKSVLLHTGHVCYDSKEASLRFCFKSMLSVVGQPSGLLKA